MVNPIDRSTTRAMIEYRQEQLVAAKRATPEPFPNVIVEPFQVSGLLWGIRRSMGIRIMQVGARLAGVCMQVRPSVQS